MPRPTSFRLPADLLGRLEAESHVSNTSVTSLVVTLLDEGLKIRQFPGIVYRSGPAGRRAGLVGGPDVWEVVRDLRHAAGDGMARIAHLAEESGLSAARITLAADFYAAFPDEIDARVEADEQAAERARTLVDQRDRLLSSCGGSLTRCCHRPPRIS
ncbi:MAG: hypothetical protein Q8K72_00280 [Acidimicrobiales bacterium]|nr:hypothetical protein [Acidimicrobiales bacterium]